MTGWHENLILGYDCETTGVDTETARIVSSALTLHAPEGVRWSKDWLLNPGCDIPLEATAVHGISTEEAQAKGISPAVALDDFMSILSNVESTLGAIPLVVFNAPFDLTILDRELRRAGQEGLSLSLPVIDPLALDRAVDMYRPGRRTLTAISAYYGVRIAGAHTAHGDVLCSIRLARAIGSRHPLLTTFTPERLHKYQRDSYRNWTAHLQEWRRFDDPGFTCDGDWPWTPADAEAVTS